MFELRKIGIVKRASAQLLDLILLAVLATGFMFLISLMCNYRSEEQTSMQNYTVWEEFRKTYVGDVAAYYGYTYEEDGDIYVIKKDGEESPLDELMNQLCESKGEDSEMKEAYDAYMSLPSVAEVNAQYKYVLSLLFMMISIGILLSYIILEFVLPIIFKNGQTVGKKVFGICLVRPNCVKITTLSLFARTLLGKYAIETMFPVMLVFMFLFGGLGVLAIVLFAALELLNIILFFALKNRTPIHDLLAGTVAADMKLQMIFESEEELAEKKALKQKEFIEQSKS
ncbi:MAG: RDD family protein [Clostridia bacterium]|nr:RDD family protein [Clostridia bacterium]MDE6676735.1 RDD family protein [Clostridia bacterium]